MAEEREALVSVWTPEYMPVVEELRRTVDRLGLAVRSINAAVGALEARVTALERGRP